MEKDAINKVHKNMYGFEDIFPIEMRTQGLISTIRKYLFKINRKNKYPNRKMVKEYGKNKSK